MAGLPNWLYDCVVRAKHARSVFEASAALAHSAVPPMRKSIRIIAVSTLTQLADESMDSAVPSLLAPAPAVDYSM